MVVRTSIVTLTLLFLSISPIDAVPANSIKTSSLITSVRTKVSKCSQWISTYEKYWNQFNNCHQGESTTQCCELYDFMDKSVRIFKDGLDCVITNFEIYDAKYTEFCKNGIKTTSTVSAGTVHNHPPAPAIPDAVPSEGGHGIIEIVILDDGTAHTSTVTHTGGGGGGFDCSVPCNCQSCACASHCGSTVVQQPCTTGCAPAPPPCSGGGCQQPCQSSCPIGVVNCVVCGGAVNQPVAQPAAQPAPAPAPGAATLTIPTDDDNDVCFHGDGVVLMKDGSKKLMRNVEIGDFVQVGDNKFSEVFMFTHRNGYIPARFVNLQVDDGRFLKLTPSHFIHSNKGLVQAGSIVKGDQLEMDDGKFMAVKNVNRFFDIGLFNPQTMHGDIVVSGFKASTYTTTIESQMAHSILAPLRALYRISGFEISWLF